MHWPMCDACPDGFPTPSCWSCASTAGRRCWPTSKRDQGIPPHWSIGFRLDRTAVVGQEAVATSALMLRIGDREPVEVIVNAHFVFADSGLIRSLRMFFDEAAMTDGSSSAKEIRGSRSRVKFRRPTRLAEVTERCEAGCSCRR